jgi:tryptophanase
MLVMDTSLLADNLHFVKTRKEACRDMSIRGITRAMVRPAAAQLTGT